MMMKFSRTILLALIMASCMAGCMDTTPDVPIKAGSEENKGYYDSALRKYNPPVTLNTVGSNNPDMKFKRGETLENNVHTRWAEERLGIKIRYQWTTPDTGGAYAKKIRLELSKGTLPDVVVVRDRELIQELIDSGQFAETGEWFEQYASAIWKNAILEEPSVWDFVKRGDKKYAIPILDYRYTTDPVLWIRKDWLDKLQLPAPTTIDELEQVMEAFTTGDPDGNGIRDTYGLSIGFKEGPSTWMADSSWIFGAYGTIPEQWNQSGDGKLEYGSIHPGAKEALWKMRDWIHKGYISNDSEWYDEMKAAELFVKGKAGIIAGPYWMSGWPLNETLVSDPKAEIRPLPIPVGPGGLVGRRGTIPVNGAVLINKKMKDPQIFFTYQNYLFDNYATSQGEFEFGLAKDYDWTVVDGEVTDESAQIPGGGVRVASYTLTYDGARIPSRVVQEIEEPVSKVLFSQIEVSRPEQYTGPPTRTLKTKQELLTILEQQTYKAILFRDAPDSEFQLFVDKWLRYGGGQITEEVNDWYKEKQNSGQTFTVR